MRGGGSMLDYFAARAAVAKYVVFLQVLNDPSSLPVLCSAYNPVLLTLTGGSIERAGPTRLLLKGCATSGTMWAARRSCLQSCRLDSRLHHPATVLQLSTGETSLPRCLLLQQTHVSNANGSSKDRCQRGQMQNTDRSGRDLNMPASTCCKPLPLS